MPTILRFVPARPSYLLQAGSRTVKAGETFEASPEDAQRLVLNDDIEAAGPLTGSKESTTRIAPDRAERKNTTDSED